MATGMNQQKETLVFAARSDDQEIETLTIENVLERCSSSSAGQPFTRVPIETLGVERKLEAMSSSHHQRSDSKKEQETSTRCSAKTKFYAATTSLITFGSILTAASTLVYLQNPAVAFLIALHAPQALVIATAVLGACMLAYGVYLAARGLCASKKEDMQETFDDDNANDEPESSSKSCASNSCMSFFSLCSSPKDKGRGRDKDSEAGSCVSLRNMFGC